MHSGRVAGFCASLSRKSTRTILSGNQLKVLTSSDPLSRSSNDRKVGFSTSFRRFHSEHGQQNTTTSPFWRNQKMYVLLATGAGALGLSLYLQESSRCESKASPAGIKKPGLPTYTQKEVSKHNTKETGIWVTYKDGVYDITEFCEGHPGGTKILLAAGGALEPYWALYAVHKSDEVFEMLEELRIGNFADAQMVEKKDSKDPFANDPVRLPALIINSSKPFNAEPPRALAVDTFITPNQLFYVRNHLPVPLVDAKKHKLEIAGKGLKSIKLNVDELKKKYKKRTVTSALMCAGNRRSEMSAYKTVKGLSWGTNAISNAEWGGVYLRDILMDMGVKDDDARYAHVQFEGLDKGPEGSPYGASIPIEKAMNPYGDVLVAYEMNGEEIPRDHGYPLRLIAPGIVGARNVKWLSRIVVSHEESRSFWQQSDYKSFNPSIDWSNVDFKSAESVQETPVCSVICEPEDGQEIPDAEEVTVRGYAYSGGGSGIARVDVSVDGGKTWHNCSLEHGNQKRYREWAWTIFEATIPVPKDHKGKIEVVSKAVDRNQNVQPKDMTGIWNLRGLMNNTWHKVNVKVPKE